MIDVGSGVVVELGVATAGDAAGGEEGACWVCAEGVVEAVSFGAAKQAARPIISKATRSMTRDRELILAVWEDPMAESGVDPFVKTRFLRI
ncbi:MAG: hypothetical protein WD024_03790 [Bacillota bacterium]